MYFERDGFKNVLDYCDYSRLCNVITKYTDLRPNMLRYGISFSLSASQRAIEWKDANIPYSEVYVN